MSHASERPLSVVTANPIIICVERGSGFKVGKSLGLDGEQHTDRAVRAEGRSMRYRGPSYHQTRQSCHPSVVAIWPTSSTKQLQSAVISQQTFVAFMTVGGIEEISVKTVTAAVS